MEPNQCHSASWFLLLHKHSETHQNKNTQPWWKILQPHSAFSDQNCYPSISQRQSHSLQSSGEILSDDSCCKWPPTFIVSVSSYDPIDHQLIHLAKGSSQKKPCLSSCLLRPWLTPESLSAHPTPIIISGLRGFVFGLWGMFSWASLRNYRCPVCKEQKKITWDRKQSDYNGFTMLLLLLSPTNTSWCNLTPLLF